MLQPLNPSHIASRKALRRIAVIAETLARLRETVCVQLVQQLHGVTRECPAVTIEFAVESCEIVLRFHARADDFLEGFLGDRFDLDPKRRAISACNALEASTLASVMSANCLQDTTNPPDVECSFEGERG